LTAYNLGDGLRAGNGTDPFKAFRTSSPTLAAGLVWLARTTIGRRASIYLQPGKLGQRSYLINLSTGSSPGRKGAHLRRPQDEVRRVDRRPYRGWMCDLATESGRFAAGPGMVVIHNSPRRGPEFITRKISRAVARIKLGLQEKLSLGTLDTRRDWGYAPEYVEAMWMMLRQDEPDDFVIATGETHTGQEFLERAFEHAGVEDWQRFVEQDPRMLRPAEVDHLIGDASKAKEKLGWEPKVRFEELVRIMVDADLKAERDKL
jgi:GDPmannose 4,6-dehydratase